AFLLHNPGAFQHGVGVVHRVEQNETAYAVDLKAPVDEPHEFGIGLLPCDEAETCGDELERRSWHGRAHAANALPGIVSKIAHGYRHVGRGGEIGIAEADAIELWGDFEH